MYYNDHKIPILHNFQSTVHVVMLKRKKLLENVYFISILFLFSLINQRYFLWSTRSYYATLFNHTGIIVIINLIRLFLKQITSHTCLKFNVRKKQLSLKVKSRDHHFIHHSLSVRSTMVARHMDTKASSPLILSDRHL